MKRLIYRWSLLLILASAGLSSCTKDFDKLNENPNDLKSVAPGTLLAPAQYYGMWQLMSGCHTINHELMQYSVHIGTVDDYCRYVFRNNEFDAYWLNLYRRANDLNDMYQLASAINDVNNMGAALVTKAWFVSNLTDMFGDIPYTEAFRGKEQLFYPKFDSQQSIYDSLLADLKRANSLFNEARPFEGTDLIYANDVLKWKKFCNALRLRLLVRVSGRPEMNAPAEIAEMVADPQKYPLFTSNDDEAIMRFSGDSPFINAFSNWRTSDFMDDRRMGKTLMDIMNKTVDGRRFRYAGKNSLSQYTGIASGYSQADTYEMSQLNGGYSKYATALRNANYPYPILTYAEMNFNLAEAVLRGWISGDAKAYYDKAVEASYRQWNCTWDGGAGTTFLARSTVKFNGTLDRVMEQKYVALFFCGFEAWYEYRRTGLPVMPIGPAVENQGVLPTRFTYPLIVKATNQQHYQEQVSRMGEDNMRTKVWWQQ